MQFTRRVVLLALLTGLVGVLFAGERSGKWPTVRAHYLEAHPTCAACGSAEHLTVHHILPFQFWPEKELDTENLIMLCESPTHNCHLIFGHLMDYHSYNPSVRKDAEAYLAKRKARPMSKADLKRFEHQFQTAP